MKCVVPEISWHNRDPVYAIDVQPKMNQTEKFYRLASGGADSHVVIWYLTVPEENDKEPALVEFAADLDRHVKAVNVVRFSKDGECLASGGDDAIIIIWKLKKEPTLIDSPSSKDQKDKETWISWKVLKGHLEDVYDLSWSSDSTKLISGSVDNTAIIWDVTKGRSMGIVGDHKGFVQGVAWDPKDKYLATMCTDRTLRIFNRQTKRTLCKIAKAKCPNVKSDQKSEEKFTKLFHDDTLKTFFRRLCYSPDGEILITPSGIMEDPEQDGKSIDVSYVFTRNSLNQPLLHLPSPGQYSVAAKCCPTLFHLRNSATNLFALPYRIVYAIATKSTVIFYDTQQMQPFAFVSNIHYTGLTDISWSSDGRVLTVSSSEGYCSIIVFEENELGIPYKSQSEGSEMKVESEKET